MQNYAPIALMWQIAICADFNQKLNFTMQCMKHSSMTSSWQKVGIPMYSNVVAAD